METQITLRMAALEMIPSYAQVIETGRSLRSLRAECATRQKKVNEVISASDSVDRGVDGLADGKIAMSALKKRTRRIAEWMVLPIVKS